MHAFRSEEPQHKSVLEITKLSFFNLSKTKQATLFLRHRAVNRQTGQTKAVMKSYGKTDWLSVARYKYKKWKCVAHARNT